MVKNPPANAGIIRHGFDPWVGKISWKRYSNPLQYSCLETPMDRGAWQATVLVLKFFRNLFSFVYMYVYIYSDSLFDLLFVV